MAYRGHVKSMKEINPKHPFAGSAIIFGGPPRPGPVSSKDSQSKKADQPAVAPEEKPKLAPD